MEGSHNIIERSRSIWKSWKERLKMVKTIYLSQQQLRLPRSRWFAEESGLSEATRTFWRP
jgi:hypothetical protein